MDFDYKKYSLEKLEEWMHDAISTSNATPQEIYDVIKNVVDENYHMHKLHAGRCYELLALLNGNGKGHLSCDKDDPSEECKSAWTSFWETDSMPPWGHSDMEALRYTEEELNAMCDHAAEQEEQRKMTYDEAIAAGWEMTADGFWIKEDKVKRWKLPVEVDGPSGEYFICFPDDLLEAANLEEGDQVNWVDNGDGSYTLTKVTKPTNV
jgi:hypothetical protein